MREATPERLQGLEEELRRRGVASLALFGSVARGEAGPDSDIDLLIDIAPGYPFSLVDLASLKNFLSDRLGREADVVTREGLDPAIREQVLREAERVF
ncbi:MAG: nucleotidyltransferase family protein [Rhodospirillaceae bacterium]|nr:nucleotidyltransferase family protein [Rhodospirillaceae bacterium]MCY4065952.1 nucleotidyltransferase family protein [Rhodospirillaceae bacterium]